MALDAPLTGRLEENRRFLRKALGHLRGVIFRDLVLPAPGSRPMPALLVFMEAQVDRERLEAHLLRPLFEGVAVGQTDWARRLTPDSTPVKTLADASQWLFRGFALLQISGTKEVFAFEVSQMITRQIPRPEVEAGVSGPDESFTESLTVSLTQLRRRLPGPDLRIESVWIGDRARIESVMIYMDQRPSRQMLAEIRQGLAAVKDDGVQDVTELAEAISGRPPTVFPTVLITERPDLVIHYVLSGRIAVMLENSPRALIMPSLFLDFFTSSDDHYESRPFVVLLRLLRFLAFNVAVPLPALYVAVTTFHLQALPTELTLSLLAQREGAPLPPPVEALIMTVIFEILREAGVRLPRAIGQTVSIVGGLVIGEAAIRSGLTSPAMVLVVALTAVASFSLPSTTLANAATYWRFAMLFLTSVLGFFGLIIGYVVILANLSALTSLGVPYASPLFPLQWPYLKTALGLRPRPPKKGGTHPPASMVREAEHFHEGDE